MPAPGTPGGADCASNRAVRLHQGFELAFNRQAQSGMGAESRHTSSNPRKP
jgi:hypothetical protein